MLIHQFLSLFFPFSPLSLLVEKLLAEDRRIGTFCHGNTPSFADVALVPQVVNAERYRLDLAPYPMITRIFESCMRLEAFAAAHPDRQPDYER